MANTLDEVIDKILAMGLMALRETCVMPSVVNSSYSEDAKQKGQKVEVPIPSAGSTTAITPANIAPDPPDVGPQVAEIPLDHWEEAAFQLSDKEIAEVINDTMPMQASEKIKALANSVNSQILSNYEKIGGNTGTPGTTPFTDGTTKDASQSSKVLNVQLAPITDRRFVLDPEAYALALELRAFQDYAWGDALDVIREGVFRQQRLGFDWFMDQLIPTHTAGDRSGATVNGAQAIGSKTLAVTGGTGSINPGDTFMIAGDSTMYSVSADNAGVWTIYPWLKVATSGGEAITMTQTGASASPQNLALHRDCIGFASRPLQAETMGLANQRTVVDPVSRLALTLEIRREYYRTRWAYSLLWGSDVVRPELGCRLFG